MLSVYIVLYRDYLKDVKVERFDSRAEAQASFSVPAKDPAVGGFIVGNDGDLRGISSDTLRNLYNAWLDDGDRPVTKFENRSVAYNRFLVRLETRFQHLPASKAPVEEKTPGEAPAKETATQENSMATATAKKEKVKKEKSNGNGHASRVVGKPAGLVSAFKQVRPGTARQKILRYMAGGDKTVASIAKSLELDEKTVLVHANTMHRDCAIGYKVDDGKLVAIFPGSKTYEDAVKAEPPAK